MAFPETLILDHFNRPNQGPPPSADWTPDGGDNLGVLSNRCAVVVSNWGRCFWNPTMFGPDCEVYATVYLPSDLTSAAVILRTDAHAMTGYILMIERDNVSGDVLSLSSNSSVGLLSYPIVFSDGDSIGLSAVGNALTVYYKPVGGVWGALGSIVDSDELDAGYVMLMLASIDSEADDFGGGTLTPPIITLDLADGIEVGETPSIPTFVVALVLSDSAETQDVIGAMAQISGTLIELHDHASGYAPAHVLNLVEGDRLPVLVFSLTDANGGAFDLSAATTTLRVRARDAEPGTFIINEICDYVPISGYVQYDLQAGDLDAPGEYYCDLQVDLGRVLTSEIFLIRIREAL